MQQQQRPPPPFLLHSGVTCAGDEDLYVHLFRGGRITIAGASGRVRAMGELVSAGGAGATVRYAIQGLAAPVEVPFASEAAARQERRAAEEALQTPGAVLGEGEGQGETEPEPAEPSSVGTAPPVLPRTTPPLSGLLSAPLKHITLPPATPEIAYHLLRALEAAGQTEEGQGEPEEGDADAEAAKPAPKRSEGAFPTGYLEVDLPADTWVLYRGPDGQARAVPGPLPMVVWRRRAAPRPEDRIALMERLRATAAPLMRSWADPVLSPPVAGAGALVF